MAAQSAQASLIEVFLSFQGEGPHVGQATWFVRSAGCPLRCRYCDTVYSYHAQPTFPLRGFEPEALLELNNPIEPARLFAALPQRYLDDARWLSLTGGEPLLFPDFARELFAAARKRKLRTMLETAALHRTALEQVLPATDHLSMDIKLRSTLLGANDTHDLHQACLEAALQAGVDTAVKIVVTNRVTDDEWHHCIHPLIPFRERFQLVVQPVTPCHEEPTPVSPERLIALARHALQRGFQVLLLPQVHKALGLA